MSLDIASRLKRLLPPSWFGDGDAPVRDTVLALLGSPLSWAYSLYTFVLAQTRLATSQGIFVDLFALDFLGTRFRRRLNEPDAAFAARISAELVRPRSTRAAITQSVVDLTGVAPQLFEPWNPGDNGAWNTGRMAYAGVAQPAVSVSGWNAPQSYYGGGLFSFSVPQAAQGGSTGAGNYGSMLLPNQVLVRVQRGSGGVLIVGPSGGYNLGPLSWGTSSGDGHGFYTDSSAQGRVTDAAIYDAVAQTMAAGCTAWVHIGA